MEVVRVVFNKVVTDYPDCRIVYRDPFIFVVPMECADEDARKNYLCAWYKGDPGVSAIVIDQDKVKQ